MAGIFDGYMSFTQLVLSNIVNKFSSSFVSLNGMTNLKILKLGPKTALDCMINLKMNFVTDDFENLNRKVIGLIKMVVRVLIPTD